MRNSLNIYTTGRERIVTCRLTPSPRYDLPLLRVRSRECSTHILYTYSALEPRDVPSEVWKALQLEGNRNTEDNVKCWPVKYGMRNALNIYTTGRERIVKCQLTSPGYDLPLLRVLSRECSTHILYTYPALEPSDGPSEVWKALQLEGNRNTEDDVKCWPVKIWDAKCIEYIHNR